MFRVADYLDYIKTRRSKISAFEARHSERVLLIIGAVTIGRRFAVDWSLE